MKVKVMMMTIPEVWFLQDPQKLGFEAASPLLATDRNTGRKPGGAGNAWKREIRTDYEQVLVYCLDSCWISYLTAQMTALGGRTQGTALPNIRITPVKFSAEQG